MAFRVYRIESSTGHGPFSQGDGFTCDMNSMPPPREERLYWPASNDAVFAFTCVHSFMKWVSLRDCMMLDEEYKVTEYEVTGAALAFSRTQTIFDRLMAVKAAQFSLTAFHSAHAHECDEDCECYVQLHKGG